MMSQGTALSGMSSQINTLFSANGETAVKTSDRNDSDTDMEKDGIQYVSSTLESGQLHFFFAGNRHRLVLLANSVTLLAAARTRLPAAVEPCVPQSSFPSRPYYTRYQIYIRTDGIHPPSDTLIFKINKILSLVKYASSMAGLAMQAFTFTMFCRRSCTSSASYNALPIF